MRNFCLALAALTIASPPVLAQSNAGATAQAESAPSKKTTKKVCKRVADVNSLVAKKVCRVVVVDANPQSASQLADQQGSGTQGANE